VKHEVAAFVEGHGEVKAVGVLIRRIAAEVRPEMAVDVLPPLRVPRAKLVKPDELERTVELAARKTSGRGAVLVLVDSDDDCPAELGPELLHRARRARGDIPLGVVLAKREYEGWFLAAAESLAGCRGLNAELVAPADPEAIRGAKEWLTNHMVAGAKYREVLDQPALSARFDLAAARRSDSFDKCFREIARLVEELRVRTLPHT
jgi:hypothetical protein